MGRARDAIQTIETMLQVMERAGLLDAGQVRAVNEILNGGDRAKDTLAQVTRLVSDAERSGAVSAEAANVFWSTVGGRTGVMPPVVPARAAAPLDRGVTISLRVSGSRALGGGAQVNQTVERALSQVAAAAGLRVTPGSVTVIDA